MLCETTIQSLRISIGGLKIVLDSIRLCDYDFFKATNHLRIFFFYSRCPNLGWHPGDNGLQYMHNGYKMRQMLNILGKGKMAIEKKKKVYHSKEGRTASRHSEVSLGSQSG